MIYAMMLPTQVRRPTPDDPSTTEVTRYQFCPECLARLAYRSMCRLSVEEVLLETNQWKHPRGADAVVRVEAEQVNAA